MNKSRIYWAPMESAALGITLVVAAICMGLPVLLYKSLPATGWAHAVCVFPIVVFLVISLFAVKGYEVEDGVLYIKRTLWSTAIPLRPLESAEISPDAMASSWRTFGISGAFGWIGWFRNETLGPYCAWVTDRSKAVVIKTGGKTYVVSPLDPWKFVQALQPLKA